MKKYKCDFYPEKIKILSNKNKNNKYIKITKT